MPIMVLLQGSSLAPKRIDSGIVLTLDAIQFVFPSTGVPLVVAVVFAMFALDIMVTNHRAVRPMFASLLSRHPPMSPSRRSTTSIGRWRRRDQSGNPTS